MDTLLEDYKAYYKARMERYEGNSLYPNSYQSEKALYEAMNSCTELIQFKEKIGDLNIKNAIALVQDQASARLQHYTQLQESKRALGPQWQLERIGGATNETEVVTIASECEQESMIEISVDGFIDHVWGSLIPALEKLDVARNAQYPSKYESVRQADIQKLEQYLRDEIKDIENQAGNWKPGWKLDLEVVWEHRHRKNIPLSDDVLRKRLNELKNFQ